KVGGPPPGPIPGLTALGPLPGDAGNEPSPTYPFPGKAGRGKAPGEPEAGLVCGPGGVEADFFGPGEAGSLSRKTTRRGSDSRGRLNSASDARGRPSVAWRAAPRWPAPGPERNNHRKR